MKRTLPVHLLIGTLTLATVGSTLVSAQAGNTPLPIQQQAVTPEVSPPGDIPDTQVFVAYTSPQGFHLEVPEGWARSGNDQRVHFADKYGSVDVQLSPAKAAPTTAGAQQEQIAALLASNRAVEVSQVQDVQLPGGPAIRIDYASNSEPNPVTDKQIRLENAEYLFYKDGKLVALTFSAPYGADNVDQWRYMSESFGWS